MTKQKMLLIGFSLLLLIGFSGIAEAWAQFGTRGGNAAPPFTVAKVPTVDEAAAGAIVEAYYFNSFEDAMQFVGADPADYQPRNVGNSLNTPANAPSHSPEPHRHCVVQIAPLQPGQTASKVSESVCFDNFADAISAATKGAVHLAPTILPGELTPEILESPSATVIGIDYSEPNFQGSTLVWTTDNTVGCNTGFMYESPTMPSGWNDVVSSAAAYGGCNNYRHFADIYYGDPVKTCTCATMGVMDNQTSSEKWSQ